MKQRRKFRGEAQARRHGRVWGAAHYRIDILPGMEAGYPRPPEFSLKPADFARWAAFDDGMLKGYLDAAEAAGLVTPVES